MALCLDPTRLPGHGRILLGFSGGPDSVCLAALLSRLKLNRPVLAVHVEHGLDPDSSDRARRAVGIATDLGLDSRLLRVEVDRHAAGPEAAARKARYRALAALMSTDELLLTAHHADDQAETILMRLLRGAGPAGLSGIPEQRRFGPGWLARPLLQFERTGIVSWLEAQDLEWIEDPTNLDLAMDRNFVRHRVMPLLRQRWPGVAGSIRRSGQLNQGAAESLAALTATDLERCLAPDGSLRVERFSTLNLYRQGELLRLWCHKAGLPAPPGPQLEEFIEQLASSRADRHPELRWHDHRLVRQGDSIWLIEHPIETPRETLHWDGSEILKLPDGLGKLELLHAPAFDHGLSVRFGQAPGERLLLSGQQQHRAVKQLMNESGVPVWQRALWPRLYHGSRLLAVGQRWLDRDFEAWLAERGAKLRWRCPFASEINRDRMNR